MKSWKQTELLLGASAIVAILILWIGLTRSHLPELVLPSPEALWNAAIRIGPVLLSHAGITLLRVTVGLAGGVLFGFLMGLALSYSRKAYSLLNPLLEIVRPLPPVALIPFFIIWFGIGATGQLLLIGLSAFMVATVSSYSAAQQVPVVFIRAAQSLGASKIATYRSVIAPAIMPQMAAAVRVAAALSFAVGVASEFMGAQSGLGFLIMVARRTLNTDVILLCTIVIGLEAAFVDKALRSLFGYMCRWTESIGEFRSRNVSRTEIII